MTWRAGCADGETARARCSALTAWLPTALWPRPRRQFDSDRAWEHLRQLVAIGPRPAGSPAIEQTRDYIKTQLAAAGVAVAEQAWDEQTPLGKVHMVNLVATIPGARADRIVIAGHYDTKLFRNFRFVGANDGGSSAAFLLELARVLKARKNPLTIELLFLDGEEALLSNWDDCGKPGAPDNTYGSRHYVGGRQADAARWRAQGAHPRRHGRRPRSAASKRDLELDAVAHRHRLGRGQAPEARRLLRAPTRRGSKTTTCPSSRPASRRSTSSTSTTRPGTRPGHARRRQRPQPAGRRRRPARRPARDRSAPRQALNHEDHEATKSRSHEAPVGYEPSYLRDIVVPASQPLGVDAV